MVVTNDDRPHPVPQSAYLRYKENWFFLIFDKENEIFGAIHVVSEPIFERIRFACHLSIKGEPFSYGNEIPFPEDFAFSSELGDGKLTVKFVKAHEHIDLVLHTDDIDLNISFLNRSPLFNFDDFDSANPEKPSLKEVLSFGTNQQHIHQQQGMTISGEVRMKTGVSAGQSFSVEALGYRDHSRSIRSDNLVKNHYWTGLHFSKHVFGIMSVTSLLRPQISTNCGYVYDEEQGLRPLRDIVIDAHYDEQEEGLPNRVTFRINDIYGSEFTITSNINMRYAQVPLQSEKPSAAPFVYKIFENFVPVYLEQAKDEGIGLVEIGWSEPL